MILKLCLSNLKLFEYQIRRIVKEKPYRKCAPKVISRLLFNFGE